MPPLPPPEHAPIPPGSPFPEDHVPVIREYLLPDRAGKSKLPDVDAGLARTEVTERPSTHLSGNQTAADIDSARRLLRRFLGHEALTNAARRLGLADAVGAYDQIITRDFAGALTNVNAVPLVTDLPRITQDQVIQALRTTPTSYWVDRTNPGPPGSDPEEILVRKELPGYGGPGLMVGEVTNLLALGDLVRGGPERDWRLGLLKAEIHLGMRQFESANTYYAKLLADSDTNRTQKKFVALRSGRAQVGLGDTRYRAARRLDDQQRGAAGSAYKVAIQVMQAHGVSTRHPDYKEIVDYAQQQVKKLAGRINFLGLQDGIVPVQRLDFLSSQAELRRQDAQDAVDRFEDYKRKADDLADLESELNEELRVAKDRAEIAENSQEKADKQTEDVRLQLANAKLQRDAHLTSAVLGGVGSILSMATSPPTSPLAIASAGVGVANAIHGFSVRRQELANLVESAELHVDIALLEEEIADLELGIATGRVTFLDERLTTTKGRNLSKDLYYALSQRFEQLAETHLDAALRLAFLYERAVAFFLGRPQFTQLASFDFRRGGELLRAPADLVDPLRRITEARATDEAQQDRFPLTFSLRSEYPIEFSRFLQTGVMDFAMSLYQIEKKKPGTHKVRIETVTVKIEGLIPPTGIDGSLKHDGRFLLRDKESTMAEPRPARLVPTEQQVDAELARQRREGTVQAAIGGVIPYALDPDTVQLDDRNRTGKTEDSDEFVTNLLEGYGPNGLWRLSVREVNPAFISDVLLDFDVTSRESDVGAGSLEERVLALIADYERELGADLDRITAFGLRQRFPDAFEALSSAPGTFLLQPSDFFDSGMLVKTVVMQALDADSGGVAGIGLEISKPGTGFLLTRTTFPDGFSEDVSAGAPPEQPPANRPPGEGRWQIRLTDPAQFASLGELQMFFICTPGAA